MARYSNPFVQYLNGNGVPFPGAKIEFFETGTTTDKDTFSDSGLTTPNANPVIADADGRIPDIFLSGIYKVVLRDADDVVIDTADPVGETEGDQFNAFLSDNIYAIPDIVKGSDNNFYRSLINANQGNDPVSSPVQWEELELGRIWNPNVTYSATDSVYGSDGNLYKSKAAANLNKDPVSTNNWDAASNIKLSGAANHITGLVTANGTDTDHDIDIATGTCADSTNVTIINLTTAITKQIDVDFAEGTAAGGFPSGLTLAIDTTYHIFVIAKPDGTVDAGFDTSLSATNLLADATGFTLFRRIGSVYTDGSFNLVQFIQVGDEFMLDIYARDISTASAGTAGVLLLLSVPIDLKVQAIVGCTVEDRTPAAQTHWLFTSPDQTDSVPSLSFFDAMTAVDSETAEIHKLIRTNTAAQMRYRGSSTAADIFLRIYTKGWIDSRGRD